MPRLIDLELIWHYWSVMPWTDKTPCSGSALYPGGIRQDRDLGLLLSAYTLSQGQACLGQLAVETKGRQELSDEVFWLIFFFFFNSIATAAECKAHSTALCKLCSWSTAENIWSASERTFAKMLTPGSYCAYNGDPIKRLWALVSPSQSI